MPPRPTKMQLERKETPTGKLRLHNGVVLQAGPFNGVFLRAGCVRETPWHRLWETLRSYITYFVEREEEK